MKPFPGIFFSYSLIFGLALLCARTMYAEDIPYWKAKDLNPVTFKKAPAHPPLSLSSNGKSGYYIAVMDPKAKQPAVFLQNLFKEATGIELEQRDMFKQKKGAPAGTFETTPITGEAIVIGDCPEARAIGIDPGKMPPEGFEIKTAPGRVHIVGRFDGPIANGMEWGVYEFVERFLNVRWYFPQAEPNGPEIGRDVPSSPNLEMPAVWLEDHPFFRMRTIFPAVSNSWQGTGIVLTNIQKWHRHGNSWPNELLVHQPLWSNHEELVREHPEVFQVSKQGERQTNVLCYGNPQTLATYLQGIENFLENEKRLTAHNEKMKGIKLAKGEKPPKADLLPAYAPVTAKRTITVSPADVELACYCADCRKLWDDNGGEFGGASKVMAAFTDKLAREVLKRWPNENFTILLLPYLNYTKAPDGFKFPGNVEIQLCGMPGFACYKEPSIADSEQENIDKWIEISGRKIQNWHYTAWPAHKTKAAYHYVHVPKEFYKRNLDKTVGSFLNGDYNEWPRQNISIYCWQRTMWNPDYNADAAVDAFATRMFGPASKTMRELIGLQIDGWEKSRWTGGRLSPKGIYAESFPKTTIDRMKELMEKAKKEAAGDKLVTERLEYYEKPLIAFFNEADIYGGKGLKPLAMQKVGEDPLMDGKLDDPIWQRSTPVSFVIASGKQMGEPVKYPTEARAVWTNSGVTFGFRMTEPTPNLLETANGGHDNGTIWWDDNFEILLDPTGKKEGIYYLFIINSNGDYWDSYLKDPTWECKGINIKTFTGKDFWSAEVFMPYAAFADVNKPGSGTNTRWYGNFTRHRIADNAPKSSKPKQEGSVREYQRMNTIGAIASDNLLDFGELQFIE